MKKIVYSILILFMFVFSLTCIKATTIAQAPEILPETDETVKAILDDEFDFSKISFTSSDGTSDIIGHNYMRKIMLSLDPNAQGTSIDEILGDSWFTVYCLDGSLKFPMYSYTNFNFSDELTDDKKLQQIIMFELFNSGEYRDLFSKLDGFIFDPSIEYELVNSQSATDVIDAVEGGQTASVLVKNITYTNLELETYKINASDLTGNASDTTATITLDKSRILFDNYYATLLDNKDYNHALWIIEHSYPTLDINTSLMMADASYNNLLDEIKALHDGEVKTDEEWEELVENYVYSTVQYAIWKANDGIDVNGNKLGNELKGSDELNKLYQYLIKDRDEYKDYMNLQFTNTLGINYPDSKNEIYSETKDYYVYGPYTVSYSLISLDRVDLSIEGNEGKASIVDETGNEITSITPTQNFYIKVMKDAKIANVKVKLSTLNALTFFPTTNRGRIYSAYYPAVQNVISGGKIVSTDIEKTIDVVFNPKTGAEDIAILFVIAIVAFSLGYLILGLKNQEVKF